MSVVNLLIFREASFEPVVYGRVVPYPPSYIVSKLRFKCLYSL